jgi:hypothetical protein
MEEKDLTQEPLICLICAWRKDCAKKYSFTGGQCLEFSRDVAVKLPEEKDKSKKPV